jgi:tetratricopeptide (TPR) repeat protein
MGYSNLCHLAVFGTILISLRPGPVRGQVTNADSSVGLTTDTARFLRQTERFLRADAAQELVGLSNELAARGFPEASKRVIANLTTTEKDFERLVRLLLQYGQFEAAADLLQRWRRREPQSTAAQLLDAAMRYASGELELALRQLRVMDRNLQPVDRAVARLLLRLIELTTRSSSPGIEVNPWGVRFEDEDGSYSPGRIAPAELAKIPIEDVEATIELVTLLPRHGNLWALLGELLNAHGDPESALECFRRAEILQYAPKLLGEHRRKLQAHAAETRRASIAALDKSLAGPSGVTTSDSPMPSAGSGWKNLPSNPRMVVVLVLGGMIVVFLGVLQVRQWWGRIRRTAQGEQK